MEETKKQPNPAYVTPDSCPPDTKNGGYMSFESDEKYITYFQVTNDLNVWIKSVSKDQEDKNITTFNGEAAEKLLEYIQFRVKSIKEADKDKQSPYVEWFDASSFFPPKEVDEKEGEQQISIDVLVYNKEGAIINAWFDYERAGWYCFGVGEHEGLEEHLTNVTHWCFAPKLPERKQE